MTEPAVETHSPQVYRVAVRRPPFWPDRPAIWFAQAEAQFELAAITQQRTKFNYVVSQLNQQQAAEVEDIIISPPEHEPYDRLKAELVRRLSTSREQRVRQLLSHEEMGDRKPSQFLRHLKGLAPDVPDEFLRTIWASRLPQHVQAILAGQTEVSLDAASHLADKICEVTLQPATASISPTAPDHSAGLLERIEELSRQVASLRASGTHCRSQSRDRRHSQSRDPSRSTANYTPTTHGICWYHQRFGDEARKCTPPCSHQQKDFRQQRDARQKRDSHQQENPTSRR
jgi:hypothetical protein